MKIAIVGAGIMGRLMAYFCLKSGFSHISLFDQDSKEGKRSCSIAASGLLALLTELEKGDLSIYAWGKAAISTYWPLILKELGEDIYFSQLGTLVVAHPQDKAEQQRFIEKIAQKVPETQYEHLTKNKLLQLEPELTVFEEAYYFKEEAQLDSQKVFDCLQHFLLQQKKIEWHAHRKVRYVIPYEVHFDNSSPGERFDWVIDTRGLGSKDIFPDLQALRGELIWLQARTVKLTRPIRFLHPRYSLYIAPRPHSIYIIGASEIPGEDYSPLSVRTALEFLSAAYYLHPGFAEARIIKTTTQCRPVLPHYLPEIKEEKGLTAVNGLYRHGFLIGPSIAAYIAEKINDSYSVQ